MARGAANPSWQPKCCSGFRPHPHQGELKRLAALASNDGRVQFMSIFDKGFFTILGCAALLVLVAVPLALRKIPRNIAYGFRTRATMASDEIWYEANAHFGRGLIVSTLCGTFVAYLVYVYQPFSPDAFLPVSILLLVAPGAIAALATASHVRTLRD